jgi:hypothetical protein
MPFQLGSRRTLADQATDPGRAQLEWQSAYRNLVREAHVIPTNDMSLRTFVSARLHNYQTNALATGPIVDQMWVK